MKGKRIERKQGAQPKFSESNDKKLMQFVKTYGTDSWEKIAKLFRNKSPKQCRDRWENYVNPDISKAPWSEEEDNLALKLYSEYGPKWTMVKQHFEKRTANDIRFRVLKLKRREKKLINKDVDSYPVDVETRKLKFPEPIEDPRPEPKHTIFLSTIPLDPAYKHFSISDNFSIQALLVNDTH